MGLIDLLQDYYTILRTSVKMFTQRFVCYDAVPRHPYTGNLNQARMAGKDTQLVSHPHPEFTPPLGVAVG